MSSKPTDLLVKIDRTPLVATVMERITVYIESQGLDVGARLPSERELRVQFNVGRSTVREALKALEALGVIEIRQGAGVFVAAGQSQKPAEPAGSEAAAPIDWSMLGPVVEARLAIEPYAAALAARRRTPQDLELLAQELAKFNEAAANDDKPGLVMADVSFHEVVARIANPVLAHTLRDLGVLLINSRYISLQRPERRSGVADRHQAIYDAIAAGDSARASETMAAHLTSFVHELGYETVGSPRGIHLLEMSIPDSLRSALESIELVETRAPEVGAQS